jgi:hypothetical protein
MIQWCESKARSSFDMVGVDLLLLHVYFLLINETSCNPNALMKQVSTHVSIIPRFILALVDS